MDIDEEEEDLEADAAGNEEEEEEQAEGEVNLTGIIMNFEFASKFMIDNIASLIAHVLSI